MNADALGELADYCGPVVWSDELSAWWTEHLATFPRPELVLGAVRNALRTEPIDAGDIVHAVRVAYDQAAVATAHIAHLRLQHPYLRRQETL